MRKKIIGTALLVSIGMLCNAQTELSTQEAKSIYKTTTKKRVSVHDPSVVYDSITTNRYYIFGSHKSGAYTTDLQNWTTANPRWQAGTSTNASNTAAFSTPQVKQVKKGGVMVDFPQFNAVEWAARTDASYSVDGNMWAPDVVWNPVMKKWCMYMSINGDKWHSSIVLLTADKITGPWAYQAPVVISGFYDTQHTWKDTDLELVIGTQTSLPSRYNTGNAWGNRYPNNIDPCVFYDEEGNLWMAYGSWSGGIWMLQLDEETGLRDYDVTYKQVGSGDDITTDPYFGKKIAGGHYVSGEGAYIEHIGDYYYLFLSYGGLEQSGGYEMRVFRSEKPDGPYLDPGNRNAVFTSYSLNFGPKATARGQKLLGPYSHWGFMPQGERAQGHNSIIAAPDGRTYLVYHTRFCNDSKTHDEGHQVRVHQVFVNNKGWLVASPFEYNGDATDDADIASTMPFTTQQLAGTYSMLIHKFANDHQNLEQVEPVTVTLLEDGKVTGDRTGSWAVDEAGKAYVTLTLAGVKYHGVAVEQTMDEKSLHALAITASSTTGVGLWAYKMMPKYALAWHVNNQTVPVSNGLQVKQNIDLASMSMGDPNVQLSWTSSLPEVISNYGRYNPTGLQEDTEVTLTAQLTATDWLWKQDYTVKAMSESNSMPADDWQTGLLAHYGFDNGSLQNTFNPADVAQLRQNGTSKEPELLDGDNMRNGAVVHLFSGPKTRESYVSMPNPFYGKELADGATISFWVQRADENLWDALFAFTDEKARLYVTGNMYAGYNDGEGNYLDVNYPDKVTVKDLSVGQWHLFSVVFQRTATSTSGGITFYVDGKKKASTDVFQGTLNGNSIAKRADFDYSRIVDFITSCPTLYLGYGSFWGSPNVLVDDIVMHDTPLKALQLMHLMQMMNRVFSFSALTDGIDLTESDTPHATAQGTYDMAGRRVAGAALHKGVYIHNGKKTVVR